MILYHHGFVIPEYMVELGLKSINSQNDLFQVHIKIHIFEVLLGLISFESPLPSNKFFLGKEKLNINFLFEKIISLNVLTRYFGTMALVTNYKELMNATRIKLLVLLNTF